MERRLIEIIDPLKVPGLISQNPAWNDLMARHSRTAMTYAGLVNDGGTKPVEHAEQFVNDMLNIKDNYADFLDQANFMELGSTGTQIDDWELNEVGDIRKHTARTAQTHNVTESSAARTITPTIIDLRCPIDYERMGRWLKSSKGEGVNRGKSAKMILEAIRIKFRRELQNLWFNGDTDSTAGDHLTIQDSWIKLGLIAAEADSAIANTWAATPDIQSYCDALIARADDVRHGEMLNHPDVCLLMHKKNQRRLRNQLKNLTSDKGMRLYTVDPQTGIPEYDGVPIKTANYLPQDVVILTLTKNLACGLSPEISSSIPLIEYDRKIDEGYHLFMARVSGGCNIAKAELFLISYDDANQNYVDWAAL